MTSVAWVANNPSFTITLMAGAADGKKALLVTYLAGALACRAGHGALSLRGTASPASAAGFLARNLDFCLEAEGGISKRDLEVVAKIRAAFGPMTTPGPAEDVSKPEKVAEYVAKIAEDRGIETAEAALHAVMSKSIVPGAFFQIAQDAVRLGGFLKILLGFFGSRVFIGVVFDGELAICALDLLIGGFSGNTEHLVVVSLLVQTTHSTLRFFPVRLVQGRFH